MDSALKLTATQSEIANQGEIANGIFATLEALSSIAKGARLSEIQMQIDGILSKSLEAHVDNLFQKLEARR